MLSKNPAERKEIVKQQVAASMYYAIPFNVTDELVLPEFRLVVQAAEELIKKTGSGPSAPGVLGTARMY